MSVHIPKMIGAGVGPTYNGLGLKGVITLLVICTLSALVAGTQYLAWQYNYAPALGEPLIGSLYGPWNMVRWWIDWQSSDPLLYQKAAMLVVAAGVMVFSLFGLAYFLVRRKAQPHTSLHGTAHWATQAEIEASGLLSKKGEAAQGVFVGGWADKRQLHYLRHNGPEHIAAFAPTRSGKGVSLVGPTLLSWPHSLIAYDLKGEAWALTAGWRQQYAHNKVLRFEPTDASGRGARFNPLQEIRIGEPEEVGDAQNLATIIADPEGRGLNDHWMKTGHAFLVGIILHCLYKVRDDGRVATLTDLSLFLSDPHRTVDDALQAMLHYRHLHTGVHPAIAQSARDMLNREERERSSVHSTTVSFLTLYRDPVITQNTSESDFSILDLMNHSDPVSLYLVVKPSDKDRLRPLIRIILTQIIRRLTERMEFEDGGTKQHYKHRLLLMLDEFASLGKLDVMEESLSYLAGYGIKAYLILQDLAQLHKTYSKDESIISACQVRVAFAPNKIETAELLSRMTGKTTVIKKAISTSGSRFGGMLNRVSETVQEIERPLLTADECMRLPAAIKNSDGTKILEPGDMLIMPSGFNAIYGKQPLYFADPVLSDRSKIPPPTVSDRLYREHPERIAETVAGRAASQIHALFQPS